MRHSRPVHLPLRGGLPLGGAVRSFRITSSIVPARVSQSHRRKPFREFAGPRWHPVARTTQSLHLGVHHPLREPDPAAPGSTMRPDQAARQAGRKPGRGFCSARDADGGPQSGVGVRAGNAALDADVEPIEVEHLRHQRRADLEDQVRGSAAAAWQFPAQSLTSCVLRIRPGLRNARRGYHLEALTLLNWPDARVHVAEPGPASCIQTESAPESGTVVAWLSLLVERVREIWSGLHVWR